MHNKGSGSHIAVTGNILQICVQIHLTSILMELDENLEDPLHDTITKRRLLGQLFKIVLTNGV